MLAGGVSPSTVSGRPALRILASTSICQKENLSPPQARHRIAKRTVLRKTPCCRKGYYAIGQKDIAPCCAFPGQRGRRPSHSLTLEIEGDGAPTGRWPGLLQAGLARFATGPGRETSRPAPCGAPTRHLRLTPHQRSGRTRSCLSLEGFSRARPWVRGAYVPARRLPLPLPALRTPPEGAPRTWIGMDYT
jgi:hypothetical protein